MIIWSEKGQEVGSNKALKWIWIIKWNKGKLYTISIYRTKPYSVDLHRTEESARAYLVNYFSSRVACVIYTHTLWQMNELQFSLGLEESGHWSTKANDSQDTALQRLALLSSPAEWVFWTRKQHFL